MSLDKNRVLVECECGLIFRIVEAEIPASDRFCDLVPEKDLGARRKQCYEVGRKKKSK